MKILSALLITFCGGASAIGAVKEQLTCANGAIFTSFDLTDSENTRYLFGIISSLQMIWCTTVTVLTTDSNACKSGCFDHGPLINYIQHGPKKPNAPQIKIVDAKAGDPNLHPLGDAEGNLTGIYDVFVLVGETKLPQLFGIGKLINFYVCGYPVDYDMLEADEKVQLLASYDGIISPSNYVHGLYSTLIRQYYLRARKLRLMLPDMHVVFPFIPPLTKPKDVPHFSALNNTVHISFYGDFFPGALNNGHDVALVLFGRLVHEFPAVQFRLNLIGMRRGGAEADGYISNLKNEVTSKKLSVTFQVNPTFEDLSSRITESLMVWEMTGIHAAAGQNDPLLGSALSSAVIQAMRAGCIVIAQGHGAAQDVIKNGKHGFLGSSINDFYKHSVWVLHASHSSLDAIRTEAMARAALLDPFPQIDKLSVLFKRSILLETFHNFVSENIENMMSLHLSAAAPQTSEYEAVIILTKFETSSEFIIRNAVRMLGEKWMLTVWVTRDNGPFYRQILSDVTNIQFRDIPNHVSSDELAQSTLLKTIPFWEATTASKVLIFNSDSLLLHAGIDDFLSYDFIGAPYVLKMGKVVGFGYTGSFSLRTVLVMKNMIAKYGSTTWPGELEEAFFLRAMRKENIYSLPSPQAATDFAVSQGYPDMKKYRTPLCLNNPWEHMGNHNPNDIDRWMHFAVEDLK